MLTLPEAYERHDIQFAMRYMGLLFNGGMNSSLGIDTVAILSMVVAFEDENRFTKPVEYFDSEVMQMLGLKQNELKKARQKAIDEGWLNFESRSENNLPSLYWVTAPESHRKYLLPPPAGEKFKRPKPAKKPAKKGSSTVSGKAIETRYKGYRFRSRLEARWAVFFDAMNLEWTYEQEGFDLGDAGWYLPDFKLVTWGTWIEIKPTMPTEDELAKFFALVESQNSTEGNVKRQHAMIVGTPGLPGLIFDHGRWNPSSYFILTYAGHKDVAPIVCVDSFAMVDGGNHLDIWTMYFRHEPSKGVLLSPVPPNTEHPMVSLTAFHGPMLRVYAGRGVDYEHEQLSAAYSAARSARFEHGESP